VLVTATEFMLAVGLHKATQIAAQTTVPAHATKIAAFTMRSLAASLLIPAAFAAVRKPATAQFTFKIHALGKSTSTLGSYVIHTLFNHRFYSPCQ